MNLFDFLSNVPVFLHKEKILKNTTALFANTQLIAKPIVYIENSCRPSGESNQTDNKLLIPLSF